VREKQFAAAVKAEKAADPDVYAPFTIDEYIAGGFGEQNWCLQWPVASPAHRSAPPMPVGGHYAAVPTMVLSGELDSITTPAEGAMVVAQIPGARQVLVANSTHVTAVDDVDGCGRALVQDFVSRPTAALPAADLKCAASVPPVRLAPSYPKSFQDNGAGDSQTRAAVTAALTAADMMTRWEDSIAGFGTGLRGGTWTSSGDHTVTLHLKGVRLTTDLAVTGTVVWHRYAHQADVTLKLTQVTGQGTPITTARVNGNLAGHWDTRAAGARVHLTGTQSGHAVTYTFEAP
jgi:hypothetical protein